MIAGLLVTFHVLLFIMLWCIITTMNIHPGEIPMYWGFYIGTSDSMRRRYCLICNAFKPERSHHCSSCNVCILNMDHHCQWLDSCIGFYNRKYFIQMLLYVCLTIYFVILTSAFDVYSILKCAVKRELTYNDLPRAACIIISYGLLLTIGTLLTIFFKFHVGMVLRNTTTLEGLDKERAQEYKKVSRSFMSV
jgi:hypothetical protein